MSKSLHLTDIELNKYRDEAGFLGSKIAQFEKTVNDKDSEILSALNKVEELAAKNQEILTQLDNERLSVKTLNEEIQKLNSFAYDSKIAELSAQLLEKEKEMLSGLEMMRSDKDELQTRLNLEKQDVMVLNDKIAELNTRLNDYEGQNLNIQEIKEQFLAKESDILADVTKLNSEKEELKARIDHEKQTIIVLNGKIEQLTCQATNHALQDSKIAELEQKLLEKESENLKVKSKLQADNDELQDRLDKENESSKKIADSLEEKRIFISELQEKLKSKEDELLLSAEALEKLRASNIRGDDAVTDCGEKISSETQTNHDSLASDNEDLKCQLKLTQKELEMLYQRVTEQEIQIRSLNKSDPKHKELEDQLEKLSAKYSMLEKTAEQTNSLNDDLNEKYLEAIKKSKNLESVVKKLYKQIEAKGNANDKNDQENQSIGEKEKSSTNAEHTQKTSIPQPNKCTPLKPSILKRSSADVEKNVESSILRESRAANSKQKLGPAARVPAIESRKIRKIDTSRDGRQECNQQ